MLVHTSAGLTASPRLEWPDDSLRACELFAIAACCAREFSPDYNDQQDLASEALLAVLRYQDPIEFPKQFLRRTIRNLCIDRSRSIGSRELVGADVNIQPDCRQACDPCEQLILRDTIERMASILSPAESRCYGLMLQGYEQSDLPALLGISRQAVSRMIASIRRKYLAVERMAA